MKSYEEFDLDYFVDNSKDNRSISHQCHHCGKKLKEIRAETRIEAIANKSKILKVNVCHWLGIKVKYFCILHSAQRCTERIIFLFGMNDPNKVKKIEEVFHAFKLVRSKWSFFTQFNRHYPRMVFGGEVENIIQNSDLWFPRLTWLGKEEKKIIELWGEVLTIMNIRIDQLNKKIMEGEMDSLQDIVDSFISALTYQYGKESLQFYLHFIDFHLVDILREGMSLCIVQNQGLEKTHSIHKLVQKNMSSNEAGFHQTSSSTQIMMRQLRLFIHQKEIL